jgi:hypothetical protein
MFILITDDVDCGRKIFIFVILNSEFWKKLWQYTNSLSPVFSLLWLCLLLSLYCPFNSHPIARNACHFLTHFFSCFFLHCSQLLFEVLLMIFGQSIWRFGHSRLVIWAMFSLKGVCFPIIIRAMCYIVVRSKRIPFVQLFNFFKLYCTIFYLLLY